MKLSFKPTAQLSVNQLKQIHQMDQAHMPFSWSWKLCRSESAQDSSWIAIVQKNGKVLGFALYRYWESLHEADLLKITVLAQWRGHGLAAQIWQLANHHLADLGATELRFEVQAHNQLAIRWYLAQGAQHFHEIPSYYSNGDTACVMGMQLTR